MYWNRIIQQTIHEVIMKQYIYMKLIYFIYVYIFETSSDSIIHICYIHICVDTMNMNSD